MRGNRAKQQQFLGLIQIVDSVPAGYGNINLEGKWKCMKLNCWGSCQSVKRNMDQCRIDMSGWVLSYQHVVMRISYIVSGTGANLSGICFMWVKMLLFVWRKPQKFSFSPISFPLLWLTKLDDAERFSLTLRLWLDNYRVWSALSVL